MSMCVERIYTKASCMTTRVGQEPMWQRLKLRRYLSTYSKTLVEIHLHPNPPFPVAASTPVSDTVHPQFRPRDIQTQKTAGQSQVILLLL